MDSIEETWAYSSADSPTFVVTTGDLTGYLGVGMKIKLTQTTVKYFIITAITTSSITLYGGTDYTLTSDAISGVNYSVMKSPFGFPTNPNKWSLSASGIYTTQANPVSGTWYNTGAISLSIPIGLWEVSYQVNGLTDNPSAVAMGMNSTLSTANNTESNLEFTDFFYTSEATALIHKLTRRQYLSLTAKTTYYLNFRTTYAIGTMGVWGTPVPAIKAVCAYL